MKVRVTNLRTPVELPEEQLPDTLARALGISRDQIPALRILRKSLDARNRRDLKFVYSLALAVSPEQQSAFRSRRGVKVDLWEEPPFEDPAPGDEPLSERPVVVGSGPAGLLAGYYLALRGYRPLIIERGQAVRERVPAVRTFDRGGEHDPENNYLFGEGGAGCFSDGKLTCRITGPDVDWVLRSFVKCGGRPSLVYEHRPHLGSNKLPLICRNYRRLTEALGGEYRFGCRLEGLDVSDGQLQGLQTSSGYIRTSACVLAIGHSARDTYEMLHAVGLPMEQKAFQLGLRIEHPQELVNQRKYGQNSYLDLLGAADYSLVARGQRDLFTFCMCAGGIIIPSISEPERYCSNGMSNSRHDTAFANSGLVVTLDTEHFGSDHPLAGMHLQRHYESIAYQLTGRSYLAPIQRARDFLNDRTPAPSEQIASSSERGTRPAELAAVLPPPILAAVKAGLPVMDAQWRGHYLNDAVLVGPEMRGSSPIRMPRDRITMQSPSIAGLFPAGEGAGYAGGIVTAAVDGLRIARCIVARYRCPSDSSAG